MTIPVLELRLHCTACNHRFERTWEPSDGQIGCPACGAPTCPCGCGGDLSRNRAKALYCTDACRKRVERSYNADISRTGIRSGNVRSVEEAGSLHDAHKKQWTIRVLRRIKWALDTKGEYHADDCADLPVPAAHVNLIGSQVMRLKNLGIVVKVEDRRNASKASNARWSGVYRYAKGGPRRLGELVGLDAGEDGLPRATGVQSGDSSVDAGQANGKRDQGGFVSSPSAGIDAPDHDVHAGVLPSSSPYSSENEYA